MACSCSSVVSGLRIYLLRRSFDQLHFNFPAFGRRHSRSIGLLSHQTTRGRSIRNENHSLGDLALDAFEGGLPPWGFDANGAPGGNADLLHVVGMHVYGPDGRLVVRVILARADLLPLLRCPAGIHEKTPAPWLQGLPCTFHPLPAPLSARPRETIHLAKRTPIIPRGPAKSGPGKLLRAERVLGRLRGGDHVLHRGLVRQRAL